MYLNLLELLFVTFVVAEDGHNLHVGLLPRRIFVSSVSRATMRILEK